MRLKKPVLFPTILSALCLAGASITTGTSAPTSSSAQATETEPGAPLGAGATLVRLIEDGARTRALVKLEMLSGSDADAVVTQVDGPRGRALGQAPVRAGLAKGRTQTLWLESDLETGRENHLYFRVTARGRDGHQTDATVYLRVNLDPSLEPVQAGEYLEYQAAPGGEVKP